MPTKSKNTYGIKKNGKVYLFNEAKHPLHPWAGVKFTWNGLRFKRLEQCLGFYKAEHFKLGKDVKQQILEAETGWDVVKILKEKDTPKDADWQGWGRWKMDNLLPILRQMAKESRKFREELLRIEEPIIGLCTKDKSLGIGVDTLPNKKKEPELFKHTHWEGMNLLGRELVQLRAELRALEEEEEEEDTSLKRSAQDEGELQGAKRLLIEMEETN